MTCQNLSLNLNKPELVFKYKRINCYEFANIGDFCKLDEPNFE